MAEIILQAGHLKKTYGSGEGKTVALQDVSLQIRRGELLVILGSSGSGKSTLLNCLGGMISPDEGEILVDGRGIAHAGDRELTRYRRETVSFVFQSFQLLQELTALENVELTADRSKVADIAPRMLDAVGLREKGDHYPAQLSGGEQQRVAIARAMAKGAEVILCDEPTGALDYETGKQVLSLLQWLKKNLNKTVVIVTHTREIAAMADRVIRMRNGQVVEERENARPLDADEIEW